eukprot:jgi/Tetstr1/455147/TSEL_041997.t1
MGASNFMSSKNMSSETFDRAKNVSGKAKFGIGSFGIGSFHATLPRRLDDVGVVEVGDVAAKVSTNDGVGRLSSELLTLVGASVR